MNTIKTVTYTVVIEKTATCLSAYIPTLKGVITTGKDITEIKTNIVEALELYYEPEKVKLSLNYEIQ